MNPGVVVALDTVQLNGPKGHFTFLIKQRVSKDFFYLVVNLELCFVSNCWLLLNIEFEYWLHPTYYHFTLYFHHFH